MTTTPFDWVDHFPCAVSVCDTQGTIIAMNVLAANNFKKDGGMALLGTSLFACHPEPANVIIRQLLRDQTANTYFVEKNGARKLVHQAPWFRQDGTFGGLTETLVELPAQVPTKKRG